MPSSWRVGVWLAEMGSSSSASRLPDAWLILLLLLLLPPLLPPMPPSASALSPFPWLPPISAAIENADALKESGAFVELQGFMDSGTSLPDGFSIAQFKFDVPILNV